MSWDGKHVPSMSKSALLLSPCNGWFSDGAAWYEEDRVDFKDIQKREDGKVFHAIMDGYVKGLDTEDLVFSGDDQNKAKYMAMVQHAIEWLETVKADAKAAEVKDYRKGILHIYSEYAMRINWELSKAEPLPLVKDRKYPKEDGWQNGSADLVIVFVDGSFIMADWKTGEADGAMEQLRSLATGFEYIASGRLKSGSSMIACLQVTEEGVRAHMEPFTQEDCERHVAAISEALKSAKTATHYEPGVHCTKLYCPHLAYCPEITEAVVSAAEVAENSNYAPDVLLEDVLARLPTDKPKNDEQAGYTMAVIAAAKRQMKYVETGVKNYIKDGGHVTYSGYEWLDKGIGMGHRWYKLAKAALQK
jgi:hypothetical protein